MLESIGRFFADYPIITILLALVLFLLQLNICLRTKKKWAVLILPAVQCLAAIVWLLSITGAVGQELQTVAQQLAFVVIFDLLAVTIAQYLAGKLEIRT